MVSTNSRIRGILCNATSLLGDISAFLVLVAAVLCASSVAQQTQTRGVDVAGSSSNCTANSTCGALQYFDAAQVAAGNCATFANNQTCALTVIEAGDTVQWTYQDVILAAHSATAGSCTSTCTASGPFDSAVFNSHGQVYSFAFPSVGAKVYPYFCSVHGATMTGTVVVQDYTVAVTNSPLTAYKGTNAAFNGQLTGLPAASNPYNFGVNLACFNATAGLSCNPPGTSQIPTTAFVVNTSAAVAGDYTFQVQGTGGVNDPDNLKRTSGTATLHVIDLSLSTPANITMGPSATSAASAFTATTAGTFPTSAVNLSCSFAPAAPTATCSFTVGGLVATSFDPSTPSPHNLGVSVKTNGTPAGDYTVTVNANPGGGLAAQPTSFTLHVEDFSTTSTSPTTVSVPLIPSGTNATYSGTFASHNGYAGTITTTCQSGATAPPSTCTGGSFALAANGSTGPVTLINAGSTTNGQFSFNIQVASPGPPAVTHLLPVVMNVGDFSITTPAPSPISAAPGNPSTATTFALQSSQVGFEVNVAFSCTIAPVIAGATCSFFPSNNVLATGTSQNVTMVVQTPSAAAPGSYTVTVKGVGNGIPHTRTVTLTVNAGAAPADMAISSFNHSPDPVQVGSTATFTAVAKNNGPNAASSVALNFDVSSGATVISASGPGAVCNIASLPVTCTLSSALAASGSVTFTIKVGAPFTRSMSAAAEVSSSATDPTAANNSGGQNENIRLRPLVRNGVPAKLP